MDKKRKQNAQIFSVLMVGHIFEKIFQELRKAAMFKSILQVILTKRHVMGKYLVTIL